MMQVLQWLLVGDHCNMCKCVCVVINGRIAYIIGDPLPRNNHFSVPS